MSAEAPRVAAAYSRLHDFVGDKQNQAWALFFLGLLVQAGLLVVLLIQIADTTTKLDDAETSPELCPKPSYMTPIWVLVAVMAAVGLLFYALAAWSFSQAHFLPS